MLTPGRPAMFAGKVQASARYMETGSLIFAPNFQATCGLVGATIASKPAAQMRSKSRAINVRTFCAFT